MIWKVTVKGLSRNRPSRKWIPDFCDDHLCLLVRNLTKKLKKTNLFHPSHRRFPFPSLWRRIVTQDVQYPLFVKYIPCDENKEISLFHSIPSNPMDLCSKTMQMRLWRRRPSIRSATEDMSNELPAFASFIDFKISHKLEWICWIHTNENKESLRF